MGLFRKRMRNPVRATARVVGISRPPESATYGNSSMTLVVQAAGMEPYSHEHRELLTPVGKWPYPGATLPVIVDRDDPARLRVDWDAVRTSDDLAQAQGQAMVESLRGGGVTAGGPAAGQVPPQAAKIAEQLTAMFPGATVNVQSTEASSSPELVAQVERAIGRDLDGDRRLGGAPTPGDGPAGQASGAVGDRIAQIERLAKLRESGAVTDAEFEAEKARILGP